MFEMRDKIKLKASKVSTEIAEEVYFYRNRQQLDSIQFEHQHFIWRAFNMQTSPFLLYFYAESENPIENGNKNVLASSSPFNVFELYLQPHSSSLYTSRALPMNTWLFELTDL